MVPSVAPSVVPSVVIGPGGPFVVPESDELAPGPLVVLELLELSAELAVPEVLVSSNFGLSALHPTSDNSPTASAQRLHGTNNTTRVQYLPAGAVFEARATLRARGVEFCPLRDRYQPPSQTRPSIVTIQA